jgi:hypothetical protein
MGNKGSKPASPSTSFSSEAPAASAAPAAPTTQPATQPVQQPVQQPSSLRDVTLRSVVFQKPNVQVIPGENGQMILSEQVSPELFDSYVDILKVMAQLSRLIYTDAGILRETMMSPVFGSKNNVGVNNTLNANEKQYSDLRRKPSSYANSLEGRPMESYVITETPAGRGFARYISSPSDLTFMFVDGAFMQERNSFFQPTDVLLSFKGSSTAKNFKHDLYSQFTPADLGGLMATKGLASAGDIKGNVPASFVKPILKSWERIEEGLRDYPPKRLFITGHSLGGAYATLCAFILAEAKTRYPSLEHIHLITFGAPTLVADKARNTFNAHLNSGFMTYDRVTSATGGTLPDIIPTIPAAFSHPGYQPLKTELYPEKKTGRAYQIANIRKVYQKGGFILSGPEKKKYDLETMTHMPTQIKIPTEQAFAHAGYFDMVWMTSARLYGMKNPGFKNNTFIADFLNNGVSFKYVSADTSEIPAEEPPSDATTSSPIPPEAVAQAAQASQAGSGRKKTRKHRKRSAPTRRIKIYI